VKDRYHLFSKENWKVKYDNSRLPQWTIGECLGKVRRKLSIQANQMGLMV
jgi:hypothetical protein